MGHVGRRVSRKYLWAAACFAVLTGLSNSLSTLGLASAADTPSPTAAVEFRPGILSLDEPEMANPMRGQYEWLEQPGVPAGWPLMDMYFRDQFQWGSSLERTKGSYDFASVEKGLETAKGKGGRLGFRIMALCPGCGDNIAPSWIPKQANGDPSWNSEEFLSSWENLNAAMGKQFNGDPRLGFVDIGGYGPWGEWYIPPDNAEKLQLESAKRIINAVVKALPDHFVIMNVNNPEEYLQYAFSLSDKVGSRSDCFGSVDDILGPNYTPAISADRWKVAPTIVEWCPSNLDMNVALKQVQDHHVSMLSSGNFPALNSFSTADQAAFEKANKLAGYRYALEQLQIAGGLGAGNATAFTATWRNDGVAPTYEDWQPQLVLRDTQGNEIESVNLGNSLKMMTSGSATVQGTLNFQKTPAGTYDAYVRVVDPKGYSRPMQLANANKTANVEYPLGSVTIGSGSGNTTPATNVSTETTIAPPPVTSQTVSTTVPAARESSTTTTPATSVTTTTVRNSTDAVPSNPSPSSSPVTALAFTS